MEHRELADWLLECILNAIGKAVKMRSNLHPSMMAYKDDGL
jgi:hypothetical protein